MTTESTERNPMSPSTITATAYEIREGLTEPDGTPYIEGVVHGQAAVIALELQHLPEPARWLLTVYVEVAAVAETPHPIGARIVDKDQARYWVQLITSLYAQAAEARGEVDVLLSDEASR